MTCGKLHVQACNFVWILSTVYLVCTAQPKLAGVENTTQAIFNLVIQRPRIAGGTLTIPLDTTVKVVNALSKDTKHHIVRLRYGSKHKKIAMRASSSHECEQWLLAITAALSPPQSVKYSSSTGSSPNLSTNTHTAKDSVKDSKQPQPNRSKKPSQTKTTRRTAPANSSLRRMVRQNIPASIQFLSTISQIIASAS
ncbi:Hypothetical protein PHPALM_16615 [Phytophthora palmivora]|uniref:PH domain-containing protein n=1 Tax=Phytophthora palmivora TaxID=4796 RepID=A0A2P4XPD3_9STRA|nr:Hypothetical protein PHPALM_16615 [Phytophthora palmivora]